MLRFNAALGSCEYLGYDMGRTWQSRVGFNHQSFSEIVKELQGQPFARRRLCIEAHMVAGSFWSDIMALRSSAFARACNVAVMVRVREPYSWYRSFYEWAVRPRQRTGDAQWGLNFTDWVPYNMQTRYLLHGTRGQPSEWAAYLASKVQPGTAHRLPSSRWRELVQLLQSQVDILAPLERFEHAMALLLFRTGFLSSLAYTRITPNPVRGMWERQPQHNPNVPSVAEACDISRDAEMHCRTTVNSRAQDDLALYELAQRSFDGLWRRDGAKASLLARKVAMADAVRRASGVGPRSGAHGRKSSRLAEKLRRESLSKVHHL